MPDPVLYQLLKQIAAAPGVGQFEPVGLSAATTAALATGLRDKGSQVFNAKGYGAVGDGVANDQAAITSAVAAAAAAGGGIVYLPPGTYFVGSFLAAASKVSLCGAGRSVTTLKGGSAITAGVVTGTSGGGSDVSISDLAIDAGYPSATGANGTQFTNWSRVHVTRVRFVNCGKSNTLFTTSPDCSVTFCEMVDSGQGGSTAGAGVVFQNGSHRGLVLGNRILGARAMAISVTNSGGAGCTDCQITDNYIDQTNSPTYEAIGVSTACDRPTISGNNIVNSRDNGISASPAYSVVVGNNIAGTYNNGILLGGNYSLASGNVIRDVGQETTTTAAAYGGVNLAASYCVVVGNVIVDTQGTPTMDYGVKEVAPADHNAILGNQINGSKTAPFLRNGASTLALLGDRPTVAGSRAGNAALASLLSALGTAGLVNDTTTA